MCNVIVSFLIRFQKKNIKFSELKDHIYLIHYSGVIETSSIKLLQWQTKCNQKQTKGNI